MGVVVCGCVDLVFDALDPCMCAGYDVVVGQVRYIFPSGRGVEARSLISVLFSFRQLNGTGQLLAYGVFMGWRFCFGSDQYGAL